MERIKNDCFEQAGCESTENSDEQKLKRQQEWPGSIAEELFKESKRLMEHSDFLLTYNQKNSAYIVYKKAEVFRRLSEKASIEGWTRTR